MCESVIPSVDGRRCFQVPVIKREQARSYGHLDEVPRLEGVADGTECELKARERTRLQIAGPDSTKRMRQMQRLTGRQPVRERCHKIGRTRIGSDEELKLGASSNYQL